MNGLSSADGGLDEESLRQPLNAGDGDAEEQSHNSIISEEDSAFEDQTPAARKARQASKKRNLAAGFGDAAHLEPPKAKPKGTRSPSEQHETLAYGSSTIVIQN